MSREAPLEVPPKELTSSAREAITQIYEKLDRELAALGATCKACGECCSFDRYGHELWLSSVELAYLVEIEGLRPVDRRGVCPYMEGERCVAREGRAVGCRAFHCEMDPKAIEELAARYQGELMSLLQDRSYGELLSSLRALWEYQMGANPATRL